MPSEEPGPTRGTHWIIPVVVGTLIALAIAWAGLNDWRFPWVSVDEGDSGSSSTGSPTANAGEGATAPIRIRRLEDGGVDVFWSIVDDPELHGYSLYVTAVRPVEFQYGVPRYRGEPDVTERLYPGRYLNKLLKEASDPRRVKAGQVWHICVQGMRDVPLNTPIDDYIIPGTRACSEDFKLP